MNLPPDINRAVLPALSKFPRQEFWQAPYGIIWYIVNKPIGTLAMETSGGYVFWTMWINMIIQFYLFLYTPLWFGILYWAVSMFHLFKATWNVSILWLCLLGLIHPWMLAVPILAKFPVGNPAPFRKTWHHALHAIPYRMSPFYYATLAIIWVSVWILG